MCPINIKKSENNRFDLVALGEVMLRLDPGEQRIRNTRTFHAWEGGGEYNVARGLRKCFGKNTAVLTSLAENDIGRLIEDLILQGGVNTEFLTWHEYDGIGRSVRNGLNFTERGFGLRGALGISDRANSAASRIGKDSYDWDAIFSSGIRWFHTGGIFAGLSNSTPDAVIAAMKSAKNHGTVVSYDLNYRPSLWKGNGGLKRAQEINKEIAKYVDVMIGNEEDFTQSLGFEVSGVSQDFVGINIPGYEEMVKRVVSSFPNLSLVATTLREVKSASRNDWSAIAWSQATGIVQAKTYRDVEVLDRVGSGDSFASGLIYGFLEGKSLQESIELGVAHGALAMTTPGDTSAASLAEVEKLARGGSARVER
jgi:2-dehydro-3-deoxygluconokinase